MGTLQQQSILKGQQIERNQEKDLIHELFSCVAKVYPSQTAIYYEGKILFRDIKYNRSHLESGLEYDFYNLSYLCSII